MSQGLEDDSDEDFVSENVDNEETGQELFAIEVEQHDDLKDSYDDEPGASNELDEAFLKELGSASKPTPFKRPLKHFVFVIKGEPKRGTRIITLPNPKTGSLSKYMITSSNELLDLQKGTGCSSWFVNDKCISDGALFFTTPMDPLFLLLPVMDQFKNRTPSSNSITSGMFVPETDIFTEISHPHSKLLKAHIPLLKLICDTNSFGGKDCYRLNEEKVIHWLRHKLDSICSTLSTLPNVSSLVRVHATSMIHKSAPLSIAELLKLSIGVLSEYVDQKWTDMLMVATGLKKVEEEESKVLKYYEVDVAPRVKRSRTGEDDDLMESPTPTKKKKGNTAAARLAKVDTRGMAPITSFFAKKS